VLKYLNWNLQWSLEAAAHMTDVIRRGLLVTVYSDNIFPVSVGLGFIVYGNMETTTEVHLTL
jgi:hypothetical protein